MENAKLYETHVKTKNLETAVEFYKRLGLELAHFIEERRVAFFWLGDPGIKEQMLGVWEVPEEEFFRSHFAFYVSLEELLKVPDFLGARGISVVPSFKLDKTEPVVHPWMPAAAYYFKDPDGNSLEYLALIDGKSRPDMHVVHLSDWEKLSEEAVNG